MESKNQYELGLYPKRFLLPHNPQTERLIMLPTRKPKPTDDQFVQKQLERIDATLVESKDEQDLAAMGLAPVIAKPMQVVSNQPAGMLILSPKEQQMLMAPFDDADFVRGAGGDQNMIYCEYSALKDRLSNAIGLGQWAFKVLGHWKESIEIGNPPKPAVRVYVEGELIIRGYKVGHGIGDMIYYPSNAKMSYSDAFEGSKTNAFRRSTKDFGLCAQVYSKSWCAGWMQRYPGFTKPERKQ